MALAVLVLSGCGAATGSRTPNLKQLPLVRGARVLVGVKRCDPGANAFCAWELVVAGKGYHSSDDLLQAERRYLESLGWTAANADTGEQRAADSPGHKLRVTYATANGDLKGIDLGWIKRSRPVTLALDQAFLKGTAALSVLYEVGAS